MLLLGIDLGTSSIKVSVIDAQTNRKIVSAQYPDSEAEIISVQEGWAEQDPNLWWEHTKLAIKKLTVQDFTTRWILGYRYRLSDAWARDGR